MTIELISQDEYLILKTISERYPILMFQNKGYEYINKAKFNSFDEVAFKTVSNILRAHIKGFNEFNNFRTSNLKDKTALVLRFQYEYCGVRKSNRTYNGQLKIKCKTPACSSFKKVNNEKSK